MPTVPPFATLLALMFASLLALSASVSPARASYVGVATHPSGETGLLYYAELFKSDFARDNFVGVSGGLATQTLTEYTPGMNLLAGPGCVRSFKVVQAQCSSTGIDRLDMYFGDGDDAIAHNGVYVPVPAYLDGGEGHDELSGGSRDDVLDGKGGADRLVGNAGDDTILALDGAIDRIYCSEGYDTVIADRGDIVEDGPGTPDDDCEAVSRP